MRKLVWCVFLTMLLTAMSAVSIAKSGSYAPRAVTLWWVIFNNPDACITNPGSPEQCGAIDIFGPDYLQSVADGSPDPSLIAPNLDSGLAVIYATGGKTTSRGYVRLAASIYRSPEGGGMDLSGENIVDPLGLGRGFEDPDAEVHLIVRDHGKRVRGGVLEQITGFLDPYCSDPNLLYFGGRNICADVQFAVYAPGESGRDAVVGLTNQKEVRRADAYLFRNGDMLQAVVETRLRKNAK